MSVVDGFAAEDRSWKNRTQIITLSQDDLPDLSHLAQRYFPSWFMTRAGLY